jgi:uncharacterized repeat protein (TIGR03803 family)
MQKRVLTKSFLDVLIVGLGLATASHCHSQQSHVIHAFDFSGPGSVTTPVARSGNTLFGPRFRVDTDGGNYAVITNIPYASVSVSGSRLFGVVNNPGGLYAFDFDTSTLTTLFQFSYTNGDLPLAPVTVCGETLYGNTIDGGAYGPYSGGVVYKIGANGADFTVLHDFQPSGSGNTDGCTLVTPLIVTNGLIYGTATNGGPGNAGTIFMMDTNGDGFTVLHAFMPFTTGTTNPDGAFPVGRLCLDGDTIFGTTASGGALGGGTVFSLKTSGSEFKILHNFPIAPFAQPHAGPTSGVLFHEGMLYGAAICYPAAYNGGIYRLNSDGSGFELLHQFPFFNYDPIIGAQTNFDGTMPVGELSADDTHLYGTTKIHGPKGNGTVFSFPFAGRDFGYTLAGFGHANASASFTWNTIPKGVYQVQYSPQIGAPNWTDIGSPITADLFSARFSDPSATNASRFYRLKVLSAP